MQRLSTHLRSQALQEITAKHYEPGNQSRCLKQVWRNEVRPLYGINYRTFLRLLHTGA